MSCIEEDNGAGEDLTDLGVSGVFTFALRLDLEEGAEEGMAVVLSALELGLVVLGLVTSRLLDLVLILSLGCDMVPGNRALRNCRPSRCRLYNGTKLTSSIPRFHLGCRTQPPQCWRRPITVQWYGSRVPQLKLVNKFGNLNSIKQQQSLRREKEQEKGVWRACWARACHFHTAYIWYQWWYGSRMLNVCEGTCQEAQ